MTQETTPTKSRTPAYIAYHVRDGETRGFFTRIGAAWPNADGKGFNIVLDVLPIDGFITLRVLDEPAAS